MTKDAYGADAFTGEHYGYFSNGVVVESDIYINTSLDWANSKKEGYYDIQSTFTHEFGHALGINHSTVSTDTMYGTGYKNSTYKRSVTSNDIAAANDSVERYKN
ncbi:matrixin family metalloprotease [Chengkuizengella axinellae]|uniref:matrixin family metalloprotease n=1 Tax=Chengkuizengella axinellae TaxID=3064388 RepID=UPI0035275905